MWLGERRRSIGIEAGAVLVGLLSTVSASAPRPPAGPRPPPPEAARPTHLPLMAGYAGLMPLPGGRAVAGVRGNHRSADLTVFDLSTARPTRTTPLAFAELARSACALSPDGALLAAPASGREILLIDAATGAVVTRLKNYGRGGVVRTAFAADGKTLAVGQEAARVYDVATGKLLATLPNVNPRPNGLVADMAVSPDGRRVALVWAHDHDGRAALVCDAATGAATAELWPKVKLGRQTGVAFAPDGKTIAVVGEAGAAVFDAADGTYRAGTEYAGGWSDVAAAPDGSAFVTCGHAFDARANRRRQVLAVLDARTAAIRSLHTDATGSAAGAAADVVVVTPDGRRAVTTAGGATGEATVKVWDLPVGKGAR